MGRRLPAERCRSGYYRPAGERRHIWRCPETSRALPGHAVLVVICGPEDVKTRRTTAHGPVGLGKTAGPCWKPSGAPGPLQELITVQFCVFVISLDFSNSGALFNTALIQHVQKVSGDRNFFKLNAFRNTLPEWKMCCQ